MHQWVVIMEALVETLLVGSLITLIIGTALLFRRGRLEAGDTDLEGSG
ncbi:MAG: hypothetical protein ACE5JD_06640 [Candidatus Methylomirabilia bacterium]